MRLPKIGTMVRARVSVLCCPEGTTGFVKSFVSESTGPAVVIETRQYGEIAVFTRDYPFFFDEGHPIADTP